MNYEINNKVKPKINVFVLHETNCVDDHGIETFSIMIGEYPLIEN